MSSRRPSHSGKSAADSFVTASRDGSANGISTRLGQRQKRTHSERSSSPSSLTSCSSDDEAAIPSVTPQRRASQRLYKHALQPQSSPQAGTSDSGTLVWIRVNSSGELASSEGDPFEESFWWPACIVEGRVTIGPLTATLYGEVSPTAPKRIRLDAPAPSHVLPFKKAGRDVMRFSTTTFRYSGAGSRPTSPTKRPRTALDEAWRVAVNLAHEADANLNDGLPSNLSAYKARAVRTPESKVKKPRPTTERTLTDDSRDASERWSPPPCDPLLEVPGELVFSLERKGRQEYWAARVEEYLPPKKPSVPAKYRVRFKDDTCRNVSRDMFFTSDEPEFYTCRLGRYMSDDEDAEVDSDDEQSLWESVSNEPVMPPPDPEDFCELPIREQFAYVKPIIKAILNETYTPARERHRAFMQGGASRRRLQKTATGKGDLSTCEVAQLGRTLQHWVLGPAHLHTNDFLLDDNISESGLSTLTDIQVEQLLYPTSPSVPSSSFLSPPSSFVSLSTDADASQTVPSDLRRQIGSPTYEALSENDKLQYCLLVLFHEAILQLLLWRSGERQSLDLLPDSDEARLRLVGLAKSEERAWVEEIFRLRGMKAKEDRRAVPIIAATPATDTPTNGRRLRARNTPSVR
ncbi:hypothetical protein BC834DRAFT_854207 [Gloeopeniophorella convolvens]|nr:hypothetical protein BC834DRAFT_854207 [Gloeopeniophorella convolvens]